MALITLDFVAKRYGKLPSELLKSGNSLDVQVASLAAEYELYHSRAAQDAASGKNTGSKLDRNLTVEQMQAMLNTVRGTT